MDRMRRGKGGARIGYYAGSCQLDGIIRAPRFAAWPMALLPVKNAITKFRDEFEE